MIARTFGWRLVQEGKLLSYIHPTAGRIERMSTGKDPQGTTWRAVQPDGQVEPRTFIRPRDARRALGSDE